MAATTREAQCRGCSNSSVERQQRQEEQKARERKIKNRVGLVVDIACGFKRQLEEDNAKRLQLRGTVLGGEEQIEKLELNHSSSTELLKVEQLTRRPGKQLKCERGERVSPCSSQDDRTFKSR